MSGVCVLCVCAQSCPNFVTPWTVAHQALLSMGFPRKEYWSGLPFPSLRELPNSDQSSISSIFCISRQILYHCANPYIRINKSCRSKNLPRIFKKREGGLRTPSVADLIKACHLPNLVFKLWSKLTLGLFSPFYFPVSMGRFDVRKVYLIFFP